MTQTTTAQAPAMRQRVITGESDLVEDHLGHWHLPRNQTAVDLGCVGHAVGEIPSIPILREKGSAVAVGTSGLRIEAGLVEEM
jgi:hypothetical protein